MIICYKLMPLDYFRNGGFRNAKPITISNPTHVNFDFLETIRNFWETGVLDDYSENHF